MFTIPGNASSNNLEVSGFLYNSSLITVEGLAVLAGKFNLYD